MHLNDSPTLYLRAILSACLIDPELLQHERKPFVFSSIAVPTIIRKVMMKRPTPLTGQHVVIATDHYIKFINSASHYTKGADSYYVSQVLSFNL